MLRRECFSFTNSYVKESNATIKAVIKQNVVDVIFFSECANTLAESFSLDEQLKLLTVKEWIILLRNTANSIIYLLKRIKVSILPPLFFFCNLSYIFILFLDGT